MKSDKINLNTNTYTKLNKKSLLLYAITGGLNIDRQSLYTKTEEAIKGGATIVQLREKNLNYVDFLSEASEIQKLCDKYKIPFVINDNTDIAKEIECDGVHIGQDDMSVSEARQLLGNDKIIGVSVQNVKQAIKAEDEGADYLGVGAIFQTKSKDDAENVSTDTLKRICQSVTIPVVAIGGITKDNVALLKDKGICGVAVISEIFCATDVKNAAKELKSKVQSVIRN